MKCRNCGTEIAANALICYRCGTAVEELPSVVSTGAKRKRAGLVAPALTLLLLVAAALLATGVFAPELPRIFVWIPFVLALLVAGWWIRRRRDS
jgi:Flp pilus assembly protein TadB